MTQRRCGGDRGVQHSPGAFEGRDRGRHPGRNRYDPTLCMYPSTAEVQYFSALLCSTLLTSEASGEYVPQSPPLPPPSSPSLSGPRHSHLCDVPQLLVQGSCHRQKWRCVPSHLFFSPALLCDSLHWNSQHSDLLIFTCAFFLHPHRLLRQLDDSPLLPTCPRYLTAHSIQHFPCLSSSPFLRFL